MTPRERQPGSLHITWWALPEDGTEEPKCRVYWGSHGCHEGQGHPRSVPHACDCCTCPQLRRVLFGCRRSCVARPPYYGPDTRFYGRDAEALGLPLVD
jgi:hypothetical protein